MSIYEFEGVTPVIHPTAYVHPSAVIIGDVWIGKNCYIGPFASLRADFNRIVIEKNSNVQDSCTIHGYPDCDCVLEEGSHIGHAAIIHTATIRKNALVGMQALIMDYAQVGENAIVAAQSFVPSGFVVPDNTLVMGSPCKIKKNLTAQTRANKTRATELYVRLSVRSANSLRETAPLAQDDVNRRRVDWHEVRSSRLIEN